MDGEQGKLAPATLKKIVQTIKRFFTWLKLAYVREYRDLALSWIEALRPPRGIELSMEHVFVTPGEVQQIIGFKSLLRIWLCAAIKLRPPCSFCRACAPAPLPRCPSPQLIYPVARSSNGRRWVWIPRTANRLRLICWTSLSCWLPPGQWDDLIRTQLPPTAMWYTPVIGQWGEQGLSPAAPGMNRGQAVAKRMRHLFQVVGLPPKSPHQFRHGHAVYALQHAKTMADYKAVSMNLMHEDIRVTDGIYAPLAGHEVQDRIASLTNSPKLVSSVNPELVTLLSGLSKEQLSEALIAIAQQLAHE